MCSFSADTKIVYRRYASLFFIAGCSSEDNELITLEIIHRYVEQMDKYYGNVCELDIIFSFTKAYYILDELLLAGELQESSKKNVLRCIGQQDSLEDMEVSTKRCLMEKPPCMICDLCEHLCKHTPALAYFFDLEVGETTNVWDETGRRRGHQAYVAAALRNIRITPHNAWDMPWPLESIA
jgi:hypothetical protein